MKYIYITCLFAGSTAAVSKHHRNTLKSSLKQKYEPGWGHNSGNSYNNGPTTHFYHGKASPYSVTKEDVQLENNESYEP